MAAGKTLKSKSVGITPVNAALFAERGNEAFVTKALAPWCDIEGVYLMTTDQDLLPEFPPARRLDFAGSLPDSPEVASDVVLDDLSALAQTLGNITAIVVDMTWALNVVWGASMVERWGAIAQTFVEQRGVSLISLYDRELLVEDQLAAALRVHKVLAAPSGLHENPHWLPPILVANSTLQDQLSFLLGRVVPEFEDTSFHTKSMPDAARGATPSWVRRSRHSVATEAASGRWHVHCLGPLRVFIGGNVPVDWAIPGSAPKKSRALFAYLLNRGEGGAHADQLSEFLWPDDTPEEAKRARLRHTLAMLRKTLGGSDTVLRHGETYHLNIPKGSWIDIRAFEQLCRRGFSLFRHQDYAAAIRVYEGAERLYGGDLFADLPLEYVESEFDDWVMPKRIWLRDMGVKLQFDFATALRHQGRLREALEHAQKALALDPVNDLANIEIMRTLAAQNRPEAITRQYQQYLKAVLLEGEGEPSDDVHDAYRELVPRTPA